jgi:hypothetical protein
MMYPWVQKSVTPPERDRFLLAKTFSYMSSVFHACHSGSEIGKFEVFLDAF